MTVLCRLTAGLQRGYIKLAWDLHPGNMPISVQSAYRVCTVYGVPFYFIFYFFCPHTEYSSILMVLFTSCPVEDSTCSILSRIAQTTDYRAEYFSLWRRHHLPYTVPVHAGRHYFFFFRSPIYQNPIVVDIVISESAWPVRPTRLLVSYNGTGQLGVRRSVWKKKIY